MIAGRVTRLSAEVADAGRGVLKLVRLDPSWADAFDLSVAGFIRSFLAPVLALPLVLITTEALNRARPGAGPGAARDSLAATALAHAMDAVGYPLLLALLARPTGIAGGYAAFVTVTNWASLFMAAALAAAAAPMLWIGPAGLGPFSLIALVCLCGLLIVLWRAGRETLSREIGPVLMAVVLAVGVDAVSGQIARALAG